MSCGAPIAKMVTTESSTEPERVEKLEEGEKETKEELLKEQVAFDDVVTSEVSETAKQEYPEFTYVTETDDIPEEKTSIIEEKTSAIEEKRDEWSEMGGQPIYINNSAIPPKKRKRLKLVPALIFCFLLVIGTIGIVKGAEIRNFVAKTVSSPEDYYKKVESRELGELVKSLTSIYDVYTQSVQEYKGTSGKVEIKLEDGAKSLLSLAAMGGTDLSWLENGYLTFEMNTKEDAFQYAGTLGLKDTGILSFESIVDLEKEKLYLLLPELSKQYISSSMNTYGSLNNPLKEYAELLQVLPKSDSVEKLLNRYIDIALDSIDDVETKKDTIAVQGVKEDATKITVTITLLQVRQMVEAITKELPEDKEFKEVYNTLYNALKDKTDISTYDEVMEEVKELYEEVVERRENNLEEPDSTLSMDIWVDDRGEVIGREFNIDTESGFRYLTAESGDDIATEINLYGDADSIVFEGKGKKSGDCVTGDYTLYTNGEEIFTFKTSKLDMKALMKGEYDGKVRVGFGQGLLKDINSGSDYTGMVSEYANFMNSLSKIDLEVCGKTNKESGKVSFTIYLSDQAFVKFIVSSKVQKTEDFSIPKDSDVVDSEDYNAMAQWESSISLDQIIKNLKKAGVPQEYLDSLEGKTPEPVDEGLRIYDSYYD